MRPRNATVDRQGIDLGCDHDGCRIVGMNMDIVPLGTQARYKAADFNGVVRQTFLTYIEGSPHGMRRPCKRSVNALSHGDYI